MKSDIVMDLCTIYLRINSKKFHTLKFLLEGYDNLAVLSSVDSQKGVVCLRFALESGHEVFELISSIIHQIKK